MDVKELEKLNEFKEKGFLTQEEFEQQRKIMLNGISSGGCNEETKKVLKIIKYASIPLAVIILICNIYSSTLPPSCSDNETQKQAMNILNGLPLLKRAEKSMASISMAEEFSYKDGMRTCHAQAKVSDGSYVPIEYKYNKKEIFTQILSDENNVFLPSCNDEEIKMLALEHLNELPLIRLYKMQGIYISGISKTEEVATKDGAKICKAQATGSRGGSMPISSVYNNEEMFVQIIDE